MEENVAPKSRPQNGLEDVPVIADSRLMSFLPEKKKKAKKTRKTTNANNITVAVNYSRPQLELFVSHYQPSLSCSKKKKNSSKSEDDIFSSPVNSTTPTPPYENKPLHFSPPLNNHDVDTTPHDENRTDEKTPTSQKSERRRTKRQPKPRQISVEKSCRRYDMNAVPNARRNIEFLRQFRNQKLSCSGSKFENGTQRAAQQEQDATRGSSPCSVCIAATENKAMASPTAPPFLGNESIIWIPSSRSEWDDCVDEMTAVCFAAAIRRHASTDANDDKPPPVLPPLSRAYIRDRIDIDDPLRGYQIRHKTGGWLQGFVLMTTFTTWTHYFKWDSLHPSSGILRAENGNACGEGQEQETHSSSSVLDDDGTLSAQLERQERSGDPLSGGVVWPNLAEISLVGALGCGEYLLQMALDDIAKRGCHDFVVLQATELSRPFYERFGFVRVGAVTKYGSKELFSAEQRSNYRHEGSNDQQHKPEGLSVDELKVVGYRHWTYANETTQRLNKHHGGPSYMMARRVTQENAMVPTKSILDDLSPCISINKPVVKALGTSSSTPSRKSKKKSAVTNNVDTGEASFSQFEDDEFKQSIDNTVVGGKKLKSPSSSCSIRKQPLVDNSSSVGVECVVPSSDQTKKQKSEIAVSPLSSSTLTEKTKYKSQQLHQDTTPLLLKEEHFTRKSGNTEQRRLTQKGSIIVRISIKPDHEGKTMFKVKDIRYGNSPAKGRDMHSFCHYSLTSTPSASNQTKSKEVFDISCPTPSNPSSGGEHKQQKEWNGIEELLSTSNHAKTEENYKYDDITPTGRPPPISQDINELVKSPNNVEEHPENMSDFIYKQRHSVWLAVPHEDSSKTKPKRKPPRERGEVILTGQSLSKKRRFQSVFSAEETEKDGKRKLPQCREAEVNILRDASETSKQEIMSPVQRPKVSPRKYSDRGLLRKQRSINQYRDPKKTYYFNRIVSPKADANTNIVVTNDQECTSSSQSSSGPFYFVLNYNEKEEVMQIIPLQPRGTFFGKRKGRIRWKATVAQKPPSLPEADSSVLQKQWYNSMGVVTVPCAEWKIVSAYAVIKTSDVAEESWDIFD